MIMVSTKFNMNFPKFSFQEDLKEVAKTIIIPQLAQGMDEQLSVNGSPYPALEPATMAKKRGDILKRTFTKKGNIRSGVHKTIGSVGLMGMSAKTLFETGKLYRSFIYSTKGKLSVVVKINSERNEVGKALQIDGVGKKHKRFNFFGISSRMEESAMNLMAKKVKEAIGERGTR